MHDLSNSEIRELLQQKRAQLEKLRDDARELQGEARLQADQHVNKLSDEIEELERHPRAELERLEYGEMGLLGAIKRTWRDLLGDPRQQQDRNRGSDTRKQPPTPPFV